MLFLFNIGLLESSLSLEYQPITEKEATDLDKLMKSCDYAVSNAEYFMETLSKDLSVLDGVNFMLPPKF